MAVLCVGYRGMVCGDIKTKMTIGFVGYGPYKRLPCSCGEIHDNDGETWRMDWMPLPSVFDAEDIFARCRRCNVCNEYLKLSIEVITFDNGKQIDGDI